MPLFIFQNVKERIYFALEENYDIPTPTLTAWCSTSELLKQFLYKYMTIFSNNQIFFEFFFQLIMWGFQLPPLVLLIFSQSLLLS